MTYYRMTGSACGSCDHHHVMIAAAAQCADRFERKCDALDVYCDRRLVVLDNGATRKPTEDELREFNIAIDILKTRRHHPLVQKRFVSVS
jgi:hypothetical protein